MTSSSEFPRSEVAPSMLASSERSSRPDSVVTQRVPGGATLLLGGARSGKSRLALDIGQQWPGPVVFIATAQVPDDVGDADLAARVRRHREERPAEWPTVETHTAHGLISAVRAATEATLIIIDCITLWVAAAFGNETDAWPTNTDPIEAAAYALGEVVATRGGPTVLVSNEVGLGVHPSTDLGRRYRDTLGRVNVTLAAHSQRTLFLVAGRAIRLEDPWTLM